MHLMLILACLSLLGVIAFQDWRYAPLRNETISAGLTGPYHVLLDAAYVPMALFLPLATVGHGMLFVLALIAGVALVAVAVTNTAHAYIDKITNNQHAKWHSSFTLVVFVSCLLLEAVGSNSAGLWGLAVANVVVPGAVYGLSQRSDFTEKVGVFLICLWLMVWAL